MFFLLEESPHSIATKGSLSTAAFTRHDNSLRLDGGKVEIQFGMGHLHQFVDITISRLIFSALVRPGHLRCHEVSNLVEILDELFDPLLFQSKFDDSLIGAATMLSTDSAFIMLRGSCGLPFSSTCALCDGADGTVPASAHWRLYALASFIMVS